MVFAYHMLYWDRFLGAPVTGMFPLYGKEILAGKIPYRDFGLIYPPLYALKSAAILAFFGDAILPFRAISVLERSVLTGVLCWWLTQVVRPPFALLAALTTGVVFNGDIADSLIAYQQDAVMWAVYSGLLAAFSLSCQGRRMSLALAAGSGLLVSLSILTKQSLGPLLMVLTILCALFLLRSEGIRRISGWILAYAAALVAPLAICAWWLSRLDALLPAIQQTLIDGPAAKGSLASIFLRPFLDPWTKDVYPILTAIALGLLMALAWLMVRRNHQSDSGSARENWQWIALLLATAAFFVALALLGRDELMKLSVLTGPHTLTMPLALYGPLVIAAALAWRGAHRPPLSDRAHWLLLCVTSFAVAYGLAISWAYYELMVLPGAALVLAALLEWSRGPRLRAPFLLASLLCLLALTAGAVKKLALPFAWCGWGDHSVVSAASSYNLTQLRGLKGHPDTVRFVESVVDVIRSQSAPGDSIMVFPFQPLLPYLTDRSMPTFYRIHYLDVLPDSAVGPEVGRLEGALPRLIVHFHLPARLIEHLEMVYRDGAPSSMSRLERELERIESAYYDRIQTLRTPLGELPVYVYSRR